MDKYVNTSGLDMNAFDADRIAAREAKEKAEQRSKENSMSKEVLAEYDAYEASKKEEKRRQERLQEIHEEKMDREARYAIDDYFRTKARADELRKQEEAKANAIDLARKRYVEKSGLYRLFHKRLSDKKAAKMTTSEINNLYGGIEEEKGKSK